jgi:hypothetical protein
MSDTLAGVVRLDREFRGRLAVVGVGETNYNHDYRAARQAGPSYVPPDAMSLGRRAFERAVADSGLGRQDIDGLCASFPYGGAGPAAFAAALGLAPRHVMVRWRDDALAGRRRGAGRGPLPYHGSGPFAAIPGDRPAVWRADI